MSHSTKINLNHNHKISFHQILLIKLPPLRSTQRRKICLQNPSRKSQRQILFLRRDEIFRVEFVWTEPEVLAALPKRDDFVGQD
jgi:hypothetical protein